MGIGRAAATAAEARSARAIPKQEGVFIREVFHSRYAFAE